MLVALLLGATGGSEMEMAGSDELKEEIESTRSSSHDPVIVAQYRSVERCGDRIECRVQAGLNLAGLLFPSSKLWAG